MERSKFNVDKDKEKRTYNNIVFDSQLEMKYYRDVLCPAVESGEVTYFELQKKYELQPKYTHNGKTVLPIIYVADFYMEYADGHIEVVDTKGCPDSVAKLHCLRDIRRGRLSLRHFVSKVSMVAMSAERHLKMKRLQSL